MPDYLTKEQLLALPINTNIKVDTTKNGNVLDTEAAKVAYTNHATHFIFILCPYMEEDEYVVNREDIAEDGSWASPGPGMRDIRIQAYL